MPLICVFFNLCSPGALACSQIARNLHRRERFWSAAFRRTLSLHLATREPDLKGQIKSPESDLAMKSNYRKFIRNGIGRSQNCVMSVVIVNEGNGKCRKGTTATRERNKENERR